MTLRVDAGAVERVAARHATAAATIDGSADTAPTGVDAGIGTGQVLDLLEACTRTAADLAALNQGVAAVVRHINSDLSTTEDSVADGFTGMGDALR